MVPPADNITETPQDTPLRGWRFWLSRLMLVLVAALLAAVALGWFQREQIARDLIGEQLKEAGIEARYTVEDIDPDRQVLTNILIGDPARPDLTIERVVVELAYGFGVPEIGRITLVRPRLYGTVRGGKVSFGALDPLLFADDASSEGLPALDVRLDDARARIDSDFGPIGVKLDGEGMLDNGFRGTLAAIAPRLDVAGCNLTRASAYGSITTGPRVMTLDGPLRAASVECPGNDLTARELGWQAKLSVAQDMAGMTAQGAFASGTLAMQAMRVSRSEGPLRVAYSVKGIVSDFALTLRGIAAPQMRAGSLLVDATVRSDEAFGQWQIDADIAAQGINPSPDFDSGLVSLARSVEGTLAAPLLAKLDRALRNELNNASLAGSLVGRMGDQTVSVVIPEAAIRNRQGQAIASLSRLQLRQSGSGTPLLSGNFRLSGANLPQMVGRMEGTGTGAAEFRLKMQPYAAQGSSLTLPDLRIAQSANGAVSFSGQALASGPLPGGFARNLQVPLTGTWSTGSGLALWPTCTQIGFDRFAYANLELNNRRVLMCPAKGRAIVRWRDGTLAMAAGLPGLDLAGTLAGTPMALKSGPIGFAYPGVATAKQIDLALGPPTSASRFVISDLTARLGADIDGAFSGADVTLAAVPLNLEKTEGKWFYSNGVLGIDEARFTLTDRAETDRFEALPVDGGILRLKDSVITASASVRAPNDGREISRVALTHNLATGTGFADLDVPGLRFDPVLQPTDLTPLALGIVANVEGVVTGRGRIDWSGETVTSSGAFSSQSLDLAAAFGPVRGANGTIAFSDLLGLTTAPGQQINVASINPGIEAKNGVIGFSLRDGQFLGVTGGEWPFMGGKLYLRPVDLNLGVAERRRYVLEVEGVDSALFVENLELGNIASTGLFDGALPLVFDEEGFGRIEGGLLMSRPGGGNVSYIGELTYEDLSPIANYAFQTLRSLNYETMRIEMDGPLTGDIVTRIQFRGVKQGKGTKQNFITRQIADLPIQFNVNISAPFYKLLTSLKSIYDPASVRDPRALGLLNDDGTRFVVPSKVPPTPPKPPKSPEPAAIRPDESAIQPSESEEMP